MLCAFPYACRVRLEDLLHNHECMQILHEIHKHIKYKVGQSYCQCHKCAVSYVGCGVFPHRQIA